MRITFRSSFDDLFALNMAVLEREKERLKRGKGTSTRHLNYPVIFTGVILFFLLCGLISHFYIFYGISAFVVGVVSGILLLSLRILATYKKSYRKKLARIHSESETTGMAVGLNDDGVRHSGAQAEILVYWRSIQLIEHEGDYIRFFSEVSSSLQIPTCAFQNPAEIDAFLEEANRLHAEHQSDLPTDFSDDLGLQA